MPPFVKKYRCKVLCLKSIEYSWRAQRWWYVPCLYYWPLLWTSTLPALLIQVKLRESEQVDKKIANLHPHTLSSMTLLNTAEPNYSENLKPSSFVILRIPGDAGTKFHHRTGKKSIAPDIKRSRTDELRLAISFLKFKLPKRKLQSLQSMLLLHCYQNLGESKLNEMANNTACWKHRIHTQEFTWLTMSHVGNSISSSLTYKQSMFFTVTQTSQITNRFPIGRLSETLN